MLQKYLSQQHLESMGLHLTKKDRDQKVKDIAELEDSIGEMTVTYMRIIEEKGKSVNIDFSQSYSEISMKREEIMGKKNLRELKAEN